MKCILDFHTHYVNIFQSCYLIVQFPLTYFQLPVILLCDARHFGSSRPTLVAQSCEIAFVYAQCKYDDATMSMINK